MCPPHLPKRPSTPLNLGTVKTAVDAFRDEIESDYQKITQDLEVIEDQFPALMETGVLRQPDEIDGETYGSSPVTNEETVLYQIDHVQEHMDALETHLSEGCRIFEKRCDCCLKHSVSAARFSRETIPIAARSGMDVTLFAEITEWAQRLQAIPLDSQDEVFLAQSGQASVFAKRLRAMKSELEG